MKALILAVALATGATSAAAQDTRVCSVFGLTGAGGVLWRGGETTPLAPGLAIGHDDRIVTDARTQVEIACDDGVVITIGAFSDFDLGELPGARAGRGYAARLLDGIIGIVMPVLSGPRFEVRTPSAVASVRSTEWAVAVEDNATSVFVREGRVAVLARGGGAMLNEGDGIDVSADGEIGDVRRWGPARVAGAGERLGFGWE